MRGLGTAALHVRQRLQRLRRDQWPERPPEERGSGVAIAVVNFETRLLVSQLVFSLYRVLGRDQFTRLVVVDNGSEDGSLETLAALHEAGLVHLIRNRRQRRHGPGLNQAVSWLARLERTAPTARYVWVLDSDVVVLRREVLRDSVAALSRAGAAIAGQDKPLAEEGATPFELYSLLLDPAKAWRRPVSPFQDHGDPARALQADIARLGLGAVAFPFSHHSYLLHVGRGTLNRIVESGRRSHPWYEWAVGHRQPHYNGHPLGPHLHRTLADLYESEVPDGRPESLVAACERSELLTVPDARPLPPVEELLELKRRGVDLARHLLARG